MEILNRAFRIIKSNISFPRKDSEPNTGEFKNKREREKPFYSNTPINRDENLAQYYANLEIPYGSDIQTTKKAWKTLMKKYHPDLHGKNPEKRQTATEITQELTKAYREIEKATKGLRP